jgi:hypothetical protein
VSSFKPQRTMPGFLILLWHWLTPKKCLIQLFSAQSSRPLRLCGELFAAWIHRGDAENAELTQSKSNQGTTHSLRTAHA